MRSILAPHKFDLTDDAAAPLAGPPIVGGPGNDHETGTAGADIFDLSQGGNDTAIGKGGDDTFLLGAGLTKADRLNGGGGNDTLSLNGTYKITFAAATLQSIETITLGAGHNYNLTMADANLAPSLPQGTQDGFIFLNPGMTIDGRALGAQDKLVFDGSHETSGIYDVIGGAGNDVLTGGAGQSLIPSIYGVASFLIGDTFDLTHGGNDTVHGGAGDDNIEMGATMTADDRIDGGSNDADGDGVDLNGDYSAGLTFGATTMINVEYLVLESGVAFGGDTENNYTIAISDSTVAGGAFLNVDGLILSGTESLHFDGSAETDGAMEIDAGSGSVGDDFLIGGAMNDAIDPGAGGTDIVDGGGGRNGVDFIDSFEGIKVSLLKLGTAQQISADRTVTLIHIQDVMGTFGNDTLTGDNLDNVLDGQGGNDKLIGNGGDDLLYAGGFFGSSSHVTVKGGAGIDTLSFEAGFPAGDGITFSLAKQGKAQDVSGGLTVNASGIENVVGSGFSDDPQSVGFGPSAFDDTLTGNKHVNALFGGAGSDQLFGGAGSDFLYGDDAVHSFGGVAFDEPTGSGISVVSVGSGDDVLTGGKGNDLLDGGASSDTASYADATGAVHVDLNNAGPQTVGGGDGTDTLVSIENLTGGGFNDTLTGNALDNVLQGGAGDDVLIGGDGSDTASFADATGNVTVAVVAPGAQSVGGGEGNDTLIQIENLRGGDFNDTLTGDGNNNVLEGGKGNDTLKGAAGNDTASYAHATAGVTVDLEILTQQTIGGGAGKDKLISIENLIGSSHDDHLTGDVNDNNIQGGIGADVIAGQGGADHFVYGSVAESYGELFDTIVGFDADMDKFDLDVTVTGIDTAVTGGRLDQFDMDDDLNAALNGKLAAGHAVLFAPDVGNQAGHTFLVVDANGLAGYQREADYVFDVTGALNPQHLSTANFL